MNRLITYLGILVLIGSMAVPVYAKWGNHGSMKGSENKSVRAEKGKHYSGVSAEERAEFERLRRVSKGNSDTPRNQGIIEQERITPVSDPAIKPVSATQQFNDRETVLSQEKDQNLTFYPGAAGSEEYLNNSCGNSHPAVTGGSCHM